MGIRFGCPDCQHQLNVKDALAGKRGRCPNCQATFRIPRADQAWADPIESQAEAPPAVGTSGDVAVVSMGDRDRGGGRFDPFAVEPGALWYARPQAGGQFGPASGETMRKWIDEGRIADDTWVWREGWAQWRTAVEMLGEPTASPTANPAAVRAAPAKAVAAALEGNVRDETPSFLERHEPLAALDPRQASLRRDRRRRRTFLYGLMAVISLCLAVALVVVLATGWTLFDRPPGNDSP
jgi:hypothetical protein